jgi:hypothetical protein
VRQQDSDGVVVSVTERQPVGGRLLKLDASLPGAPGQTQFLARLRRFVLDERDAQRQQIEKEWARPLAERVADGLAIEGVRFLGLQPDGYLELACDRNQSRFRWPDD